MDRVKCRKDRSFSVSAAAASHWGYVGGFLESFWDVSEYSATSRSFRRQEGEMELGSGEKQEGIFWVGVAVLVTA